MNENFDKENLTTETSVENQDVEEVTTSSGPVVEEDSTISEPKTQTITDETIRLEEDKEASMSDFDDITAQKIAIPPVAVEEKTPNKGLRFFCLILAAIVLISGCSLGGYYVGRYSVQNPSGGSDHNAPSLESKPEGGAQSSVSELYAQHAESVVGILVYNSAQEMGQASGIVYTEDGYIVTNDHIYSSVPSAKFKVYTSSGEEYDAYYVAGDTRSDLAVLKISDKVKLKKVTFGDSEQVISGEQVCAIGCPNGYNDPSTVTTGVVSVPKTRQSITSSYSSNFIQTDTAINPGNSGGALFNMYGQVVGVTSSKISGTSYEGVGYAIPSKTVVKVIESLIEHGNVKDRVRLGITYVFYDNAMAEMNNVAAAGLQIAEVSADSGLFGQVVEGDIITRVNDIAINDDAVILDILEELKPGESLMLTVHRKSGTVENITVKLLADEGSSSYVNSDKNNSNNSGNGGDFNFPEGY